MFDSVGGVNEITSRYGACDRMLDLTVCADISDNFAAELRGLSPEDVRYDDEIATSTQLIIFSMRTLRGLNLLI